MRPEWDVAIVGPCKDSARLLTPGGGQVANADRQVAEDQGGGMGIGPGDVPELPADGAEAEERPGALEGVLGRRQLTSGQRAGESVVRDGHGPRERLPRGRGGAGREGEHADERHESAPYPTPSHAGRPHETTFVR